MPKKFDKELTTVKETVEGGATFADALRKFPDTFDELYVNLVSAGEIGGILDTILNRLAAYIEKNQKLKGQVKSAMTYPVVSLVMVFGITIFLLVFIVPKFADIFKQLGKAEDLPLPTQILLDVSNFMQSSWYIWVPGLIGLIFVLVAYSKTVP